MAVPIGTRLGPYEILGLIGAGGMGEVYRARDTRLGRDVAIKTLPSGLGNDVERLRRFELEARAASLLSHPNILTVHDVGTVDGQPYIVSELLEGENLRERLQRGPLAPRRSVEIAAAIADALATAHIRGIVHRDLKPENLFLTRDGRVKILDFGIAKLTVSESAEPAGAPTVTILTDAGVAIGTLGYMAPEQVRGEPADPRSDIFALGAVLHEMIAGTPAFRRDSRVHTVNAVLESDPPELPDAIAPAIRRIVRRCVEKKGDERFQSARDLAFALSALSDVQTATHLEPVRRGGRRFDWRTIAVAALVASGIIGAAAWTLREGPRAEPRPVKRFSFQPTAPLVNAGLALSPDGTRLVYSASGPNGRQLYLRALDQLEAKPLAGSEGGRSPFFSPDGEWVAFEAGQKLQKLPINGGSPVTLSDVSTMLEGGWSSTGTIVIAQREHGLMTVPAEGGTLEPLTTPDPKAGEIDHHAPHPLPGGAVLFTIHAGAEVFRIAVRTATGEQRTLLDDGFFARYVASGHIVYGRRDGLFAAPFDLRSLTLTGPSVLVVENALNEPGNGTVEFATGADGTLAFVPTVVRDGRSLMWVDRTGRAEPLPTPSRAYAYPTLSPDGRRMAVEIAEGPSSNIWIYEFATDSLTRLSLAGSDSKPVWSNDGKRLSYASRRKEERHIIWQPLDSSAPPESLVSSRNNIWPGAWTANDDRLIYVEDPPTSLDAIKLLRVRERTHEPLVATQSVELQPSLSPDGNWIAYLAGEGAQSRIFVRSLAGGASRQITSDRGVQPRWARDGREIFFRTLNAVMRIPIRTAPELIIGKAEKLFDDVYVSRTFGPPYYDVTADGQRFLMVKHSDAERLPLPIHIVVNWFEELKQRVPVRP